MKRFNTLLHLLCSGILLFPLFLVAKTTIVVSIKPLTFIAAAIADGIADVKTLLPDGASPHNYALKPSDISTIDQADLIIWVGEDLETFLTNILQHINHSKQLDLTQEQTIITQLYRDSQPHDEDKQDRHAHGHHGEYDMHIWLSPELAKSIALLIHQRLVILLPQQQDKLEQNLTQFIEDITQTEKVMITEFAAIQNKGYFVFHDAYGYFERYFHLKNLGSFTINPAVQPSARKLYQIKQMINQNQVICLFSEPQFSSAMINKLVKNSSVRVGYLDPLGMNVQSSKNSYREFLQQLAKEYMNCLADRK